MEEKPIYLISVMNVFVLAFLSLPGLQGQGGWSVTYSPSQICAIKGSTVELKCTYPPKINDTVIVVQNIQWFTKGTNAAPVNLRKDQNYAGRVEYRNGCTVRIRDIRETDSAVYKISLKTNYHQGSYTAVPGVSLSVSGLKLHVIKSERRQNYIWTQMKCNSSCLPDQHPYIWIKNGNETLAGTSSFFQYTFCDTERISCAAKGYEKFPSPSVYAPRPPTVSHHPLGEVVEGSSVTLVCNSDANPPATYKWYKEDEPDPCSKESKLVFKSVQSSDSGKYSCKAENVLNMTSEDIILDVEYAPRLPVVSLVPSGDIVEGMSLTLTCSSDANPVANYSWFKENEKWPQYSRQNFTIADIGQQHSGLYHCEAHNRRGSLKSSIHFTVAESDISIPVRPDLLT
ncbi:PREDICTED: B-cell receptor CD22-like [Cyprinodon variegatus]|uniref:B-cell receptor CD22-like n=1 Tax=Cyprinodon variegatus TaxID=28743 RepID=UPI0007429EA5|nr:PREDICTED: B-cell receptor CD22-like [Cyprinodon variegatus]